MYKLLAIIQAHVGIIINPDTILNAYYNPVTKSIL